MKVYVLIAVSLFGVFSTGAATAQTVDFDIHIGNRPAPPAVFVPPPPVRVERAPDMVFMGNTGVYMAMGIPYDLFFYNNVYYYFHNGGWYRSAYYRGPWSYEDPRRLPPGLYGRRIEDLREFRRHAWDDHRERGLRFRERHFRAEEPRERDGERDREERPHREIR